MQPQRHGTYVIAAEPLAACVVESGAIFDEMWADVVGGHTTPDWGRWLELERIGELLNITVRDEAIGGAMVGYVRMYLRRSITTGEPYAEEDMVYLSPRARGLDLAHRLHRFVEDACVEAGHRSLWATAPFSSGQERYLTRHGYTPKMARFNKVI